MYHEIFYLSLNTSVPIYSIFCSIRFGASKYDEVNSINYMANFVLQNTWLLYKKYAKGKQMLNNLQKMILILSNKNELAVLAAICKYLN